MSQFSSIESERARDGAGPIIAVEDDQGRLWCFDCLHVELRRAGETPFDTDVCALGNQRRLCSQCGRNAFKVYREGHAR